MHNDSVTQGTRDHLRYAVILESPENFRAHFGWHDSLYIFETKAWRGTKLCSFLIFIPFATHEKTSFTE